MTLYTHTFDIETLGWDNPIAVGVFDGNKYKDFLKLEEDQDVIWEFLEYVRDNIGPVRLYAHNAAHFDNRFILDCLVRHRQRVSIEGGLGVLRWTDTEITFRDSYQLLRTSLEKACIIFGVEEKLSWDHSSTRPIKDMSLEERRVFRAYLERDCRSLSEVYEKFVFELIKTFDILEPGQTLAQTSLRIFDSFYPLDKIESNLEHETQIRAALYGARNEVYTRYGENLNLYDIRSMYVSCYDTPVPVGKMSFVLPSMDRGIIGRAEVEVPDDMYIPPLPLHHGGQLLFPTGKFGGWWDMEELRYAASLGVKVKLKAQLDGKTAPILKDFGEVVCKLRSSSEGDLARLWKLLGLQLVGKLAQSRSRTGIKHVSTVKDLEGTIPIDKYEEYVEIDRPVKGRLQQHIARVTKPAITMRIRAEARIRHHKLMAQALSKGSLYYCDTDSIYCCATLPTGPDAGDLQEIGKALRAYFVMNKFYGYVTPEGVLKQRSSGFSGLKLSEDQFKELLRGKTLRLPNPSPNLTSPGDIIRGQTVVSSPRFRTIRTPLSQKNRVFDGEVTKPIHLK